MKRGKLIEAARSMGAMSQTLKKLNAMNWNKFKLLDDHRAHYFESLDGRLIKTLCGKWFNKRFIKPTEANKCQKCERLNECRT